MSTIFADNFKNTSGGDPVNINEVKTDKITGKTTAGSIPVQGENTNTTNLQQGLAKEWTLFDQAGNIHGANTIGDSFNVSSCTDISTGHFDVNLSNSMNSTAYAPVSNHHYTGLEANDQYTRFSAPSYLRTNAYRIAGQYVNSSTGYEDGYFTTGMNGDLA